MPRRETWPRRTAAHSIIAMATLAPIGSLLLPDSAFAHFGSVKLLDVEPTSSGVRVVADIDPVDLGYELGQPDPERIVPEALVEEHADAIRRWAENAFDVRSRGGRCAAVSSAPTVEPIEGIPRMRTAVRVLLAYECPEPRRQLRFEDRSLFATDPLHEALVRSPAGATVLRRGRQVLELGDAPSALRTAGVFLLEGGLHLVTGYDHVLFLLSLLLGAGPVAARLGARRAARDVVLVVTAFTLGHSVTLALSALDVVVLPAILVEPVIAASIAVVALWNYFRPERRGPLPVVAGVFGLVHGFGFSSVLRELALSPGERVLAAAAFNVGIELAQILVVVLCAWPLAWAGRQSWYRPVVLRTGSLLIAAVAVVWVVTRLSPAIDCAS
ncbi:MAG: HupE/UreJ family protein [Myxococcota bacterium]|nr:HupE/UreJ family protein [Myxococcota bacterium]